MRRTFGKLKDLPTRRWAVLRTTMAIAAAAVGAAGIAAPGIAAADAPLETVHWSTSVTPAAHTGGKQAVLGITATIEKGWHVYALKQLDGGPTPLVVKVDPNELVQAAGKISGSTPEKIHDPRFDLDTQFYTQAFTLRVPLTLRAALAGAQQIPVSVRFQTCSERECQPPRTIHLTASLEAPAP